MNPSTIFFMLPITLFLHFDDVCLDDVCSITTTEEESIKLLEILVDWGFDADADMMLELLNIKITDTLTAVIA